MTEYKTEWDALITEALAIEESAEDHERRLRHLQRDILADDALPSAAAMALTGRLHAALQAESTHD